MTPAAVPQLIAELRRDFKLDDRSLADQAALKAESRKIFNRTFAVTIALNAFTLGIAGIALFTSLLTSEPVAAAATRAAVGAGADAAPAGVSRARARPWRWR